MRIRTNPCIQLDAASQPPHRTGNNYAWQKKQKSNEDNDENEAGMDGVLEDLIAADGEEAENEDAIRIKNAELLLEEDEKLQAKVSIRACNHFCCSTACLDFQLFLSLHLIDRT